MASTLIHYAISIRILEKIHVKDKFLFLMGASVGPMLLLMTMVRMT